MALTRLADFQELTGKDKLSVVEEAFIEACRQGELYRAGDGTRPDTATKDNTIRASLLRYLILGGCDACRTATQGVQLEGAYVTDQLDLSFGRAVGQTNLVNCRFAEPIQALQTRFELLNLPGSACPGLRAHGAEVTGGLFLRNKFHATGRVSLAGTKIGGQLACDGGRFENSGDDALNAEGAEVTGSLFLRNQFHATGRVSLSGAKVGGQLDCSDGRFENAGGDALNAEGAEVTGNMLLRNQFHATGRVSLSGAKIGGQLACNGGRFEDEVGDALIGERLQVTTSLIWRNVTVPAGRVDLASASVGVLVDDLNSWPDGPDRLILNGFAYDHISAAFTDAPSRLEWLKRGTVWDGEFFPQPYRQLARVLHEMGHRADARAVRIRGEAEERRLGRHRHRSRRKFLRRLSRFSLRPTEAGYDQLMQDHAQLPDFVRRQAGGWWDRLVQLFQPPVAVPGAPPPLDELTLSFARQQLRNDLWAQIMRDRAMIALSHAKDWFLWLLVGYGYAPWRSLVSLGGLFLAATFVAHMAWTEGSFAPNSDVVLVSPGWTNLVARDCVHQPGLPDCIANPALEWSNGAGLDWDSFNRYGYAADLVIPVLDLGQTDAWAPSKDRGSWGYGLWWGRWVLIASGWLISALGAAAITGLIRRDGD